MVYVFLANGFEEVEAIAPVDILRRAKIEVKTVGVTGKTVTGAHGIEIAADIMIDDVKTDDISAVVLPGGMPGTLNLEKCERLQQIIDYAAEKKAVIGAICAAPSILGHKGLLEGRKATCFTGFEKDLLGAKVVNEPCVTDENYVTAFGAGAGCLFGFKLVEALTDKEFAKKTAQDMRYPGF